MQGHAADKMFAGSIPQLYETYLVPLIFEPYARDIADRLAARSPRRVLEVAAGTGVVTRAMASALRDGVSIVATHLIEYAFNNFGVKSTLTYWALWAHKDYYIRVFRLTLLALLT